ncbi:hypothetical protein B5X24_HaOG207023 [Helicoverpa armigera]|uniref:Uncharacterized protein n=1 Tax=Helicoverpa armigera TaxID=29058 RepID=A0A2W1BMU8_HELAM|nr:hypothetical protein B5X24_HaOG207023 [Helicoverpa armigera]
MNFLENITLRRKGKKPVSGTMNESKTSTSSSTFDDASSLPDLSQDVASSEHDKISELNDQINKLTIELNSAYYKIETLLQENQALRDINNELVNSDRTHRYISDRVDEETITENKSTTTSQTTIQAQDIELPSKNSIARNKQNNNSTKNKTIKRSQTNKSQTESITTEKIQDIDTTPKDSLIQEENTKKTCTRNITNRTEIIQKAPKNKNRICIVSTDNNVLATAQNELKNENNQVCHYLTQGADIEQLLKGIDTKLSDFTYDDYCVILIGQEDFKTTKEYTKIVQHIRYTLEKIKHTNIIICFPTYNYAWRRQHSLRNWRIETFNNLLYMDIITHEHAYYLDSNRNLEVDYSMFNSKTGYINHTALKIIFQDLKAFINDINNIFMSNQTHSEEKTERLTNINQSEDGTCSEDASTFFRN